jgi:hypothetical protein
MIYLILVYIFSLILSWIVIRKWLLSGDYHDARGVDVFMCLCPFINTVAIFVVLFVLMKEHEWNWNCFFKIK